MPQHDKSPSRLRKWTRRTFLASAGIVGGGLALGLTLSPNRLKIADADLAGEGETLLNTWVKLTPDNQVTVYVPHSEMGQGAGTGLAQMLAEEMEADWDLVSIEQAPAIDAYANSDLGRGYIVGEGANIPAFMYPMLDFTFLQIAKPLVGQLTGGSTAIRLTGHHGMRRAGAAAREMLMHAAAQEWDVPVSSLIAEKSMITHTASERRATFGEMATKAAAFEPNLKPAMKDPKDYTIVGRSKPRLDLRGKVDGTAQFGMDVIVPDMLYATLALPPVRDAIVASVGATPDIAGVKQVISKPGFVAVIADSYWTATRALKALDIAWEGGQANLSSENVLQTQTKDLDTKPLDMMDEAGDVATAMASGSKIAAEYHVPYLAHATMEPMNCTVSVTDTGCEMWVGHQNMLQARNHAAKVLEIDPDQVTATPTYLGGGFGRRASLDFVNIAVQIAKDVDQPVKVIWSRETDMANGQYRPTVLSRIEGAVEDGRVTAVSHAYIDADSGMPDSERPFAFQYDVPNRAIGRVKCPSPIPVGTWRSVDFTQLGFFHECFMDELAQVAGADPLQFRLDHTSDPRISAVLERIRTEASWDSPLPAGQARGVAMVKSFETIVAQVVHVSVSADKALRVHHVTSVVDCGQVINPNAASAQITGSVVYALTAALFGEITLKDGSIQQLNFPDYEMMRLSQAPAQTVHFMENAHAPGGIGEPGTPPAAPALANAIFSITGERIHSLPLQKHGFRAA